MLTNQSFQSCLDGIMMAWCTAVLVAIVYFAERERKKQMRKLWKK